MKQQENSLSTNFSLRAKIQEFVHRTVLALGISALLALALGVHAELKPPQEISMNFYQDTAPN